MCGRFVQPSSAEIALRYRVPREINSCPAKFNVAPSQPVSVITIADGERRLIQMNWGLVPVWTKNIAEAIKPINAKSETALIKPFFKHLMKSGRCIVPAAGFYEWKKSRKGKLPYYIFVKSQPIVSFAALYDTFTDADGKQITTFAVLTVEPNPLVKEIHSRMPAILYPQHETIWLDNATDADLAHQLLIAFPESDMDFYPVSTAVNNPANDDLSNLNKHQHD
jgi:putative SOS response-associated peptidase YedK